MPFRVSTLSPPMILGMSGFNLTIAPVETKNSHYSHRDSSTNMKYLKNRHLPLNLVFGIRRLQYNPLRTQTNRGDI